MSDNQKSGANSWHVEISARGLKCPTPIIKLNEGLKMVSIGGRVKLTATDPDLLKEIGHWCSLTGNRLLETGEESGQIYAIVEKGGEAAAQAMASNNKTAKTLIIFDDDFDRALASFVITNGALAAGRKVTLFFTFWGLNILKKKSHQFVKKEFLSWMFGLMMPKGPGQLTLSKLNMFGVGTLLMRYIMRKKNVSSLEALIEQAIKSGAVLIACQMSMDVMGIKEEELIEGVTIGGVAAYLEASEAAGTNLVF